VPRLARELTDDWQSIMDRLLRVVWAQEEWLEEIEIDDLRAELLALRRED